MVYLSYIFILFIINIVYLHDCCMCMNVCAHMGQKTLVGVHSYDLGIEIRESDNTLTT